MPDGWDEPALKRLQAALNVACSCCLAHIEGTMMPYLRRLVALVCAVGCSPSTDARSFYEIGRFHAPNMHSLYPGVTHFVVAPDSVMGDRKLVLTYSRRICEDEEQVCFVLFWTDSSRAAAGFPIKDSQAEALVASYNRNRSTGHDGFQCYNFESPGGRCESR
jgi:hypothetical protein